MQIGDVVIPIDTGRGPVLHCATSVYSHAIVVSMDPFILVSDSGDMKWSHREESEFFPLCQVHPKILMRCMKRLDD